MRGASGVPSLCEDEHLLNDNFLLLTTDLGDKGWRANATAMALDSRPWFYPENPEVISEHRATSNPWAWPGVTLQKSKTYPPKKGQIWGVQSQKSEYWASGFPEFINNPFYKLSQKFKIASTC